MHGLLIVGPSKENSLMPLVYSTERFICGYHWCWCSFLGSV